MIHILDQLSIIKHATLIDQFKDLYYSGFPDINEREELSIILDRIKGYRDVNDPNTILTLYKLENVVVAGQITDLYIESGCIHLTYLIVSPASRNKGIAKEILTDGLKEIILRIKINYNVDIKAVFFESNIPARTNVDSFDPSLRLKIFSNLGAKWIDIPFTQPPLDPKKSKVNNLYLLTFPVSDLNKNSIKVEVVIGFLDNFYKSLAIDIPYKNDDFLSMVKSLEGQKDIYNNIPLFPIPIK